ncbi:MAG: PEGA domain-containing protein [Ignavibacteriales bacterium]|nr:MAG: PEGA domain-containing protein [Ignavibacteriales bacterium]
MKDKIVIMLIMMSEIFFTSCDRTLTTSPEEVLPKNYKLLVNSLPAGAKIYLDGKNTGHITPDTVEWLEARNYKLTLKLPLFKDTNVVISVNKGQLTQVFLDYTRNPNMRGTLYCDTDPRRAEIFFGDSSTGKFTPISIQNLYPGNYNVIFKKEGYLDGKVSVNVESNKIRYANAKLKDTLVWINITEESHNFPTNYLNHVAIESGYIKWVSTPSHGVIRFDDREYTVYNNSNSSLPTNTVYFIGVDDQHNKWMCTDAGLIKFDNSNWTVYNTSNSGIPGDHVISISFDTDGSKWIGTASKGIAKFDDVSWTVFNPSNSGLTSVNIKTVAVDPAGVKWIGTGDAGLFRFDNVYWRVFNKSNTALPGDPPLGGMQNNNVETITFDLSGILWVGMGEEGDQLGGTASYRGFGYFIDFNVNPSYSVHYITVDDENNKWFGNTYGGISKYNGLGLNNHDGTWTHYTTLNTGIGNDRVLSIAIDAQGAKWMATYGGGLVKYKGN